MDNLNINLWKIVNKGKYETVYTKKEDFDPERDWSEDMLIGLKYYEEVFYCKESEDGIKQILNKYPESLPTFDFNMISFCKEYVKGLLLAVSTDHGKKQVCFSKSNSELFSIVVGKNKIDPITMWQDNKLKGFKDPVYCMVYSFVRDNMNLFV